MVSVYYPKVQSITAEAIGDIMKIGYDRIVLLDYRQNLTAEALAAKGRTASLQKITQFKQSEITFVQLTDDVLVQRQHPDLTPLTALSKIIIRGHCSAGSKQITSDEHEHEFTRLEPRRDALYQQLTEKNVTLRDLDRQIDEKKTEAGKLKARHDALTADLVPKVERYLEKYPPKRGVTKISYSQDPALRAEVEKLDEIGARHALLQAATNSLIADRNKGAVDGRSIWQALQDAERELEKQTLSVRRLAEFIRDNTSTANIVPKRHLTTGGGNKPLTRRLTIQAAMCEGGASALKPDGSVEPSFLESLNRELIDFGVRANVVGYITTTSFSRNIEIARRRIQEVGNLFGPVHGVFLASEGEYRSVGFGQAKTVARPDPTDPTKTVDVPTKVIFNEDHPGGIDYATWKGSALGAAEGPMADFMLELKQAIWENAWETRGKGFMGRQIVPDGIVQLRRLLPRTWSPDSQTTISIEALWRQVRAVMAARLDTNVGTRRHQLTTEFYEKYHTVMSHYYG